MDRSATRQLADHKLGRPVEGFIAERRALGRSWPKVARDLYEATGGAIDVSFETLRNWAKGDVPAAS